MINDRYGNEVLFGPSSTHTNDDGSWDEILITRSIFEGLYFTNRRVSINGVVVSEIHVSIPNREQLIKIKEVIEKRIDEIGQNKEYLLDHKAT